MVISLVGAGGKTSVMYRLADELAAMGKRVIVTTSTHIFCPENRNVLYARSASEADNDSWNGVLVVGKTSREGKLQGLPEYEMEKLSRYADVLLIEADGARCMPIKVPEAHEPVIIPKTHLVIACCGIDAIGHPLKDVCFRSDRGALLLNKEPEDCLTPQDAAIIMTSEMGMKKDVCSRPFRIVLNKADDLEKRELAMKVIRNIQSISDREELCVVTSFSEEDEVKECL